MIHLACTHGNLGYWDYYSTVMKAGDIVDGRRVLTVSESDELYTENINEILQREVKINRIEGLKSYIQENDERFISSVVLAVHGGNPKWTEIDLDQNFEVDGLRIDDSSVEFLGAKFGVLTLTGDEQIFALDGQHRILGLRAALEDDSSLKDLEIPVMFVIHNHERLNKTRRLFTVLNKYAEKPKGAELIILDEDDAAAIVSRRLVTDHGELSKENGISSSKIAAIPVSDRCSLTTLVTINAINKILFDKDKAFYAKRPEDEVLDRLQDRATSFWDTLFEVFPALCDYIDGADNVQINGNSISRGAASGGSLLLRPVGQLNLAYAFTKFEDDDLDEFKDKLREIEFDLSSDNWKYLYWNEKMLKADRLGKDVLLYMLGKFDDAESVHSRMRELYEINNLEYQDHIAPVD